MLLEASEVVPARIHKDIPMPDRCRYEEMIDKRVKELIGGGITSFSEICLESRGAFPSEILAAIDRTLPVEGLSAQNDSTSGISQSFIDDWWPEPSPADYEWRFTAETAERIATISAKFGERILCLGTPTVFRSLLTRGANTHLVDRNPFLITGFRSTVHDRIHTADVSDWQDFTSLSDFQVVVIDPPWYPAHMTYWLSRARASLPKGGTIILTLFPELTRPDADLQRAMLLASLDDIGTYSVSSNSVSYETPLFERETLTALGVPPLRLWRRADLITLTVPASDQRLDASPPPDESRWDHFLFGTQIVSIRTSADNGEKITVSAVNDDLSFLFRSVSSRDPARQSIDLWTSRNRVASLTGHARVADFLHKLSSGVPCQQVMTQIKSDSGERCALEMVVALIGW